MFIFSFLCCSYHFGLCYKYGVAKQVKLKTTSNDFGIATPSTSMKHLIAATQDKREQARFESLPHSFSIEETENSIPFISSPSPIRGSNSYQSSMFQLHLDGEATKDTKDDIAHTESISPIVNVQ